MSTTEITLFKACIENPKSFSYLRDLRLEGITEPQTFIKQLENQMANPDKKQSFIMNEEEYLQRKAIKLFHMAWSGVTKYLRTLLIGKKLPCEFPGLGIFYPVSLAQDELEDRDLNPLIFAENNRLTKKALG